MSKQRVIDMGDVRVGAGLAGAVGLKGTAKKSPKKSKAAVEEDRPKLRGHQASMVRFAAIAGLTPANRLTSTLVFQSPPLDEVAYALPADHAEWDGLNHLRYSRFSSAGLKNGSLSMILEDGRQWYHHTEPPEIHAQIREVEQLEIQGVVFRLRVSNRALWDVDDINVRATIRNVQVSEKGGENNARYLTFDWSEYRESEAEKQARRSKASSSDTHKIVKGDTLWDLAKRYTKSGANWKKLAKLNKITGVRAHDDLYKWARKHGRSKITIPPLVFAEGSGVKVGRDVFDGG